MQIRIAEEKDYPSIIKIYNHAVDDKFATADTEHVTIESKMEWFEHHSPESYPIFISEQNGEIIGWCSLSPYRTGRKALRRVAEISYYIHKNHRKKGVANNLISFTINQAKMLGFKNLISILLDVNKVSIHILEKFGFEKWGYLPGVAEIDNSVCGQFIYGRKI